MSPESNIYAEQSKILSDTVELLIHMTEPDIDALIPMTERSIIAHKSVRERIDYVEQLVESMMKQVEPSNNS